MISNNYKDKVKSLKNSKPARTLTHSLHTHTPRRTVTLIQLNQLTESQPESAVKFCF